MAQQIARPNIVEDESFEYFKKALAKRYASRGASVLQNVESIEQERNDARTEALTDGILDYKRHLEPEAFATSFRDGKKNMSVDDYLNYFSVVHDSFEATRYTKTCTEAIRRESEQNAKTKLFVNERKLNEAVKARVAERSRPMKRRAPERESFFEKILSAFEAMNTVKRRAMAGAVAACLVLVMTAGGMLVFSGNKTEVKALKNEEVNVAAVEMAEKPVTDLS